MRCSTRGRTGPTRSPCWRSRPRRGCRSWCRSGGAGIFLGWQRAEAGLDGQQRDFYVRQLRDWKYSIAIEALIPRGMRIYGQACGWALARAHARSGDRIAIAAYLGSSDVFDQAITQFASAYADQNARDHQALVDAVTSGRLTAEPDM